MYGVKRITGFYEDGPWVRIVLDDGSPEGKEPVIIGPLLPTMAALLRIGFHGPIAEKKPNLKVVGR